MVGFDYVKARAIAESLIVKFGASGSFVVESDSAGGYDDFGNEIPPTPAVSIDGTVTPLLQYKQNEIDGEQIKANDAYVFFHSEVEPPIGSNITLNGTDYRAIKVSKIDSVGGVNVYRKIQLRG